jgi:hypothetical protein
MVWQRLQQPYWQLEQFQLLQGAARAAGRGLRLVGVLVAGQLHLQAKRVHLASDEGARPCTMLL